MEIISHPVIAMIVLLGVLVFVHELGHHLVAKSLGIGVETFSIGFGPAIIRFTYKETEYQIACIPLGGFVKLAGALFSSSLFAARIAPELWSMTA